jgi:phosphotransferase system  glucose/maltose/N-acetylglucosamine-specific IIC component
MSILFAMVTSLCAAVLAVLFVTAWRDRETVLTTALSAALLSVLVLTMMAWEEAL